MNVFEKLYKELKNKYGRPKGQWVLWCKRPKTGQEREEVLIGAILTQRTNWKNVELALNNLKRAKICSLKDIHQLDVKKLAPLIKPSGFYRAKANYLFHLVEFILENYGNLEKMRKVNLKELREQLLKLKGIGPETDDSILLYALDKPIFVIDEYTRRLVKKLGLAKNLSYTFLQQLFEKNLSPVVEFGQNYHLRSKSKFHYGVRKDFRLYQDFHALIVIDGKNKITKFSPKLKND